MIMSLKQREIKIYAKRINLNYNILYIMTLDFQ